MAAESLAMDMVKSSVLPLAESEVRGVLAADWEVAVEDPFLEAPLAA